MKHHSFVVDSIESFCSSMDEILTVDFKPNVGIVFSSIKIGIPELARAMNNYTIDFIGSSSCGEILSINEKSSVFEGSCVVTLLEIDKNFYKIVSVNGEGKTSFDLGKEVGKSGKQLFESPAFIIVCSSLNTDGEQLVKGLVDSCGPEVPIFGGLAGDDSLFKETFVFGNGFFLTNGALALIFDNTRIKVDGIATSGWIGLGAEKTVTRAEGNVVYTIDNESALDFYIKYLGVDEHDLPEIGVEYPMLVMRPDGANVLRAVMMVDLEVRSLIFAGTVPEGAKVKFSSSPGFEVVDFVKKDLKKYFEIFPESDLLLLFSCMARHMAVGPMVEEEIVEAARLWNLPVTGFFTYGEIGKNMVGNCDFFNETFTLVTLKEQ